MKLLLALFAFLTFSTLSILFSSPAEAAVTCTATSNKTQVAPGETFDITVDFSDNIPRALTYTYTGTELRGTVAKGATDPHTFTLTAPDKNFTSVNVYSQTRPFIGCGAVDVRSTKAPPSGACTFDFAPKSVKGGEEITVTINNTKPNLFYSASIGGKVARTQSTGTAPIALTINAPNIKGNYSVKAGYQSASGRGGTVSCYPTSSAVLTVTSSVSQGENPCQPGPDDTPICPTAFGDIPANPIKFAEKFLSIAIGIGGGIAFILMVFGAIRVLTSSGDQQKLSGGRDMIVAAIAGILFIIFSVMILRFVGIEILKI